VKQVPAYCALLLIALTSACARTETATGSQPTLPISQEQAPRNQDLQNQLTQIASIAKGKVGVAALVLETGETVSLNPHDHFPMQSVYKLPISMAVMKQVDAGKIRLDQKVPVTKSDFVRLGQYSPIRDQNPNGAELTVTELLRFAISESDGTASDVLMKLAGGPKAVQAYLSELKITDMIVLNTEKELGQDWQTQYKNFASPDAAVALLRALHERQGLSESRRCC
jgi:beta-lactamase class A